MIGSVFIEGKPRVCQPFLMARRFAEPFPNRIVSYADDDPFVRAFKGIVRINKFITVPGTLRDSSFYHINFRNSFHRAYRAVYQANVDIFAVTLAVAALQSCQNADAAI